jgi:hypothetical protein
VNVRPLSDVEDKNLRAAKRGAGDFSVLFLTATGLRKNILDATQPVRTLLKEKNIHDFAAQAQGEEHKIVQNARFVEDDRISETRLSLYRPITKQGDPRLWPYLLNKYAGPGDALAVFVVASRIHLLNLTRSSLAADMATGRGTVASNFFSTLFAQATAVAAELLASLREITARGPLEAVCDGDTAIGRSIEAALGIQMNAKRAPDFKGIELKSFRSTKPDNGLITLFSKTPDWTRSSVKGTRELWTRFGYERDGGRQLYCSVYATKQNSQGLQLRVNAERNDLEEIHAATSSSPVAVWSFDTLHDSFRQKHNETFWIKARTIRRPEGKEFFELQSVTHTKQPLVAQFDAFLQMGQICLDHTINQKAKDHGYLFRVRQEKFTELFTGSPTQYSLDAVRCTV